MCYGKGAPATETCGHGMGVSEVFMDITVKRNQ